MKSIIKFFSEVRTELMKVTWPSRAAAISMTLTVLGVSVVFALYISGADLVITQGIRWITLHSQQKSGSTVTSSPIDLSDIQATPVK